MGKGATLKEKSKATMNPRRLKPEQVHRWLAAAHVVLSAEFGKDGYQGNERKYVLIQIITHQ